MIVAWVLRVCGYVAIAGGLLAGAIVASHAFDVGHNPEAGDVAVLASIILGGLILLGFAEVMFILLNIEANTKRAT